MREALSTLCGEFIKNREVIKKTFSLESAYIYPVCAAIFVDKRLQAEPERLKACRDILKGETGLFSNFRGTAKLPMISMLAVESAPEEKLQRALRVYSALKEHFHTSQFLPVASMVISEAVQPTRYEEVAERTRHIYGLMKSEHPFLTSGEDSVFAALLALSHLTDEQVVTETERCYQLLKSAFHSGNAVQSLSHVLALGEGSAEEKCRAAVELYEGLRAKGYKYGVNYELATLGVLALLPAERERVMEDVMAADDFLAGQKGYGLVGVGRRQRLMHAGMLVSSDYIGGTDGAAMSTAAISGTVALIVAQEVAMCAAIAASASASAASSG